MKQEKITESTLPEFLGQIVDIFEDYCDQHEISITNPEREDEEDVAIIYGSDYDRLTQFTENLCRAKKLMDIRLTKEETEGVITDTLREFTKIIGLQLPEGDKHDLRREMRELFFNWHISGKSYHVKFVIHGHYMTEVTAYDDEDMQAILKKADTAYGNADFGELYDIEGEPYSVEDGDKTIYLDD